MFKKVSAHFSNHKQPAISHNKNKSNFQVAFISAYIPNNITIEQTTPFLLHFEKYKTEHESDSHEFSSRIRIFRMRKISKITHCRRATLTSTANFLPFLNCYLPPHYYFILTLCKARVFGLTTASLLIARIHCCGFYTDFFGCHPSELKW